MDSFFNSAQEPQKTKACRYSHEEWELQKTHIERLYVVENRPLKEVIQVLKQDHDFAASEKQIKSRLTKWGLDVKNLKSETMVEIARTKAKRAAVENKKSSFRIHKKPVDDRKIDRYLQRNDISEEKLLTMASPINALSPDFSVFTPQSARSSAPPSPGLKFQTLSLQDQELSGLSDLLPTIAKEMTDNPKPQIDSNQDAPSIYLHTRASSLAANNQILSDELQEPSITGIAVNTNAVHGVGDWNERKRRHAPPISPVAAWPTAVEEDAAKRHHISDERYLDYKARVYPKRYSGDRNGRSKLLWICHSCRNEGGMTVFIDHCPGCQHLRCSMCVVENVR